MEKMNHLQKFLKSRNAFGILNLRSMSNSNNSSSSSSSSDDEKPKEKKVDEKKKSQEALSKLNNLLLTMTAGEIAESKKLNLAQPTNKRLKKKEKSQEKPKSKEGEVIDAAQKVAESIGGDVKQTQSELLAKLLQVQDYTASNLVDLVKGMKIDHEKTERSKAQEVKQILQEQSGTGTSIPSKFKSKQALSVSQSLEKVDLFGSPPLGIFTDLSLDASEGVENKTWNRLYQKELKLAVTHPPTNYFQQMILWTEQGKIWKFPIDNEQGLTEEKKVYFTEHIFLEKHLEPWCPPKGPIRHFMELVCVGLSKNPYITVEDKKTHIMWFKKYFEDKRQLLTETGALGGHNLGDGNSTESTKKSLE